MIIKSIKMSNFRQYKGEHPVIEFSTDREKNVTVVLGVNTSGKTTLIQAFRWCLYEPKDNQGGFKTNELVNVEVSAHLSVGSGVVVAVEIVLIHEGKEYIIKRTQKFTKQENGRLRAEKSLLGMQYKEDNGNQQPIPTHECEKVINKILPFALSSYFFFDGERISEINNRGDVVSAVQGLMGLDVVAVAKDRLDPKKGGSVISKFEKELDYDSNNLNKSLHDKIEEAKIQLENNESRKDNIKLEIERHELKLKELSDKLLENREEKVNQETKLKLERDIINYEEIIAKNEKAIVETFTNGAQKLFAVPAIRKALKVIDNAKMNDEGIPNMRVQAIDHVIARGKCICGCDLTRNEGAKDCILYERSLLPPQHIGTILSTARKSYDKTMNVAPGVYERILEAHKDYKERRNFLDVKKDELINISEKIKGNINVSKIEEDYQEVKRHIESKRNVISQIDKEIGVIEKEKEDNQKSLDKLVISSEKNERLYKCIAYAQGVFEWLKQGYDKDEEAVKENLLNSVNEIFKKMYHGNRIVTLNDKYQITLMSEVSSERIATDESKGLETVKNFSFIAGLVDLARKKAESNRRDMDDDSLPTYTEPYPLVMDAPFSNADEIHIKNISNTIPDIAEQIILIVMQKDWEFAQESLNNRLGASYVIEKVNNSDTNSIIRRLT